MPNAIKTYLNLVTFAEHRKENDDPLQKAIYSDLFRILTETEPEDEAQARLIVYGTLSSFLKEGLDFINDGRFADAFNAEVLEILAIAAQYKDEQEA